MRRYLILVLLFFFGSNFAQNLVMNPSFEDYRRCPDSLENYIDDLKNWRGYYHEFKRQTYVPKEYKLINMYPVAQFNLSCKNQNDTNYYGYQKPFDGDGYSGFMAYPEKDKTVLCGELKEYLVENRVYKISFKISLAEKSNIALKDFQVLLCGLEFVGTASRSKFPTMYYHIKAPASKMVSIPNDTFYEDKNKWTTISSFYVASGFETYLIIGNFKTDLQIKPKKISNSSNTDFSFYYIDDIIIEPIISDKERNDFLNKTTFQPEKIYTFKNVLFNFDRAKLLDVSIEELNKLYKHLKANKNLKIEISGHTDNVGLETRNKELSMLRAKAVSMYLIKKGLNKNRIKWFGFGAEQPVVKNDSEENRAKNRRVDFKLIE